MNNAKTIMDAGRFAHICNLNPCLFRNASLYQLMRLRRALRLFYSNIFYLSTFSFFYYLFLSERYYLSQNGKIILRHPVQHNPQYHCLLTNKWVVSDGSRRRSHLQQDCIVCLCYSTVTHFDVLLTNCVHV